MSRRRNLLGAVAGLAAAPQIAKGVGLSDPLSKGVHAADTPSSDAALVAMAAEVRALEDAYSAGCGQSDDYCETPEGEAVVARLEATVARMAETPAAGLDGIAAKAGRLCFSLHPWHGGLMDCDLPLVASLMADLHRLAPRTTGGRDA